MRAYKLFLKIARHNKGFLLITFGIFLGLFLLMARNQTEEATFVEEKKPRLALINHSQDAFAKSLEAYLKKTNEIVDAGTDEKAWNASIFRDKVDYVLVIPETFRFPETGSRLDVQTFVSKNDTPVQVLDRQIALYATSYRLFDSHIPSSVQGSERSDFLESYMTKIMDTKLEGQIAVNGHENSAQIELFMGMLGVILYVLLSAGFTCVGMTIARTEDPKIKARELISGYNEATRTRQITLSSFVFMFFLWAIFMLISLAVVGFDVLETRQAQVGILTSAVHALAINGLILFIMQIFRSENAASFFSTAYSLLVAFSTGVFVPSFLLPDFVVKASRIFPSYWLMNTIDHLSHVSAAKIDYALVNRNLLLLVGVAVTTFLLTIILRREQSKAH